MSDNKDDIEDFKAEVEGYLRDEAVAHIRHWKGIKREADRLYREMEESTKKLVLTSKELVTEDRLLELMERNRKVQLLNLEAVKVNTRIALLVQVASSFGMDLRLDTTDGATAREIVKDSNSGFIFHEEDGRLRYNDPDVERMLSDVSRGEIKRIGVKEIYDSLEAQYKDFRNQRKEGLSDLPNKN